MVDSAHEPIVTPERVRSVAESRWSHTALVVLSSGQVVDDVPLPKYDGLIVADRAAVRELLAAYNDDAARVAAELTKVAREKDKQRPRW